ncbi:reverse transcriptase [Phytophthora megakarya]|uniref:Reverse transcriptase n=1 Tax=Phytophthora megakarya TaxID=4795 RepID=A0A225V7R1_9STRA|nr:reverse transcriptase [Phytophthora megakarya]
MFYTIIIPTSKMDIRGSAVLTTGSGIIFTGEDCIEVCKDMSIIAMDHIPSLPRSYKGNTKLLIFEDLFSGYTLAESYEECVFSRFGATEVIRHDREPGFISDFFRAFNKILDQRQWATMAYRPQANGSAERMMQTTTKALKMYVQDLDQRDWDEYTERVTFAINTARDWIRGEAPFYMIHTDGGDPDGKYKKTGSGPAELTISDPEALSAGSRASQSTLAGGDLGSGGSSHDIIGEYAVKFETAGSVNIFPVVHVSKFKPVREFPDRPVIRLTTQDQDRLDFDEALLPGDS